MGSTELHAKCSPSRLAMREACPGSARVEAEADAIRTETAPAHSEDGEETPSARGKRLHATVRAVLLGERGLLSNLDDVDLNAVQIACDRVNSLTSEGQRVFEYQVNLEHLGIENTPDGNRIDVLGFDGAVRFVVVDLKFGRGFLDAIRSELDCYQSNLPG